MVDIGRSAWGQIRRNNYILFPCTRQAVLFLFYDMAAELDSYTLHIPVRPTVMHDR